MTGVTFADARYVGQLGTAALASLALAFPFLTLMQMMAAGAIGGGTTSAVARAFGAADIARAENTAWHALLIALFMSGIFMIAWACSPGRSSRCWVAKAERSTMRGSSSAALRSRGSAW
ncbi:MAG: MATE family efflux transporter [Geminicoccaceae bacterium]